jgi:hypothetical protein
MKMNLTLLFTVASLASALPMSAVEKIRTVADIHAIPKSVLERTISPTLYQELLVSPVEGWVGVRGQLSGTHIYGTRVIHSELNGTCDKYALQLARNWEISGHFQTDRLSPAAQVVLYVLVYEIADGTMAVSFPCFEEPGGDQLEYYGSVKLAVQQADGSWADLKLPERPTATGYHSLVTGNTWAVRAGLRNNWELTSLLDKCIGGK